MHLAREVLDKEILDSDGFKAGKVDDLLLELRPGEPPIVRAIVTQHGALVGQLGNALPRLSSWLSRTVLGFESGVRPIEIGWEHVTKIDVTVHIDIRREEQSLMRSEKAIWEHLVRHLPWAER